ncbi:MAG: electron transfer flavoprotein subunit alpha/FixB family protein [Alphaproteobacteria bacterium]
MSILTILDYHNNILTPTSLSTLTCAKKIATLSKGDIDILVVGDDLKPITEQLVSASGVNKILTASAGHLAHPIAEDVVPIVLDLAKNYRYIMAPANSFGKNIMPRVAALLDMQQVSEITGVVKENVFERPIYAGNALATVESSDKIICMTVRGTAFEPDALSDGKVAVSPVTVPAKNDKVNFVRLDQTKSERPELTSAKIVISGGRGMAAKENFALLDKVATLMNAAVGASRAAVDAGYAPNDYQVGQTGKVVAPDLYIAVGISGAIQHLAGMKDSKVIVAINKDDEAPIFQVADYGLVADLFTVLPELESELKKIKK